MTSGTAPILGWAAFLTFLAAVLFAWTPHAELQWGPFALAAAAAWVIGATVARRRPGTWRAPGSPRSGAAVLLALGVAVAVNALVLGWWLALVGAVVVALSVALLAREAGR